MKTLLRSTFIAAPGDDAGLFLQNFLALNSSGLDFEIPEDSLIWQFILDFVRNHNHVPNAGTMRTWFDSIGEKRVLDRLGTVISVPPVIHGDFRNRLDTKANERRKRRLIEILKETTTIATSGMDIKDGKATKRLEGPYSAVHYFLDKSHAIVAPTVGTRLSGEATRDGADFKAEYERVATDPLSGVGQHSMLSQMDTALNGAKKYELWVHAAFTGGLKSTLMLNWAYNQAVHYLHSSIVFSLEMPYQQCRRLVYAIHSSHNKFQGVRHRFGIQRSPNALDVGVPYEQIRDGLLPANAKQFMDEFVIPDLNGEDVGIKGIDPDTGRPWASSKDYGKIHIEVADPDQDDFTIADLRHKAELIYSESPFDMIFVDHVGLMAPRRWVANTTDRLNEVIRDLKRMAMSFNRGQGIAVVGLFQINREGYKTALKRKEKTGVAGYDLTALSYANECERSADVVTTTWLDDEFRKENRVQFQCLKSRDQKPFEIFKARVEWPCRRIVTSFDASLSPKKQEEIGNEIDKL